MQQWSFTFHGPTGILGSVESDETQFVLGTEQAADVFRVSGAGVAARHAWVAVTQTCMQVEDLAGGTLVNGHPVRGRVEVEYPATVQVGEVALVVERKVAASAFDVTIPRGTAAAGSLHEQATILPASDGAGSSKQACAVGVGAGGYADVQGRYELVREIARGGMGQIYFGEDLQLKRQVAVKVSSLAYGGEDPRFAKEAQVLAHLAHPNIVPIHAMGVDAQGRPFYSMKLVKGRTLQALLTALGEGDPAVRAEYTRAALLTMFRKVCDAMAFAHSKGILHRDLKPENIMVGEYGEVLVMDWGLAKVLGEGDTAGAIKTAAKDTGDYGMTLEGEVMGTPQYMSPEQAAGMVGALDVRSDIYSLGGILYAILTLRPPIEGTTLNEVLTKVKKGEISSMATKSGEKANGGGGKPAAMGGEVPAALQAVTLKAMATDRGTRYPSVEALAADIEAYQNGFATSAEQAGAWKRTKLWVGRNKVLAGSAVAMLVVVSAFTAKVVLEGRKASAALQSLRDMAPMAALKAEEELGEGHFEEALRTVNYAVDLQPDRGDFRRLKGNVLQLLGRWEEAFKEYTQCAGEEGVAESMQLTKELVAVREKEGQEKANAKLYESLLKAGRQSESIAFARSLGTEFWKRYGESLSAQAKNQREEVDLHRRRARMDPSVIGELVRRLEAKLLPLPGTEVLLSRTQCTVGEWKLYLRAEGYLDADGQPDWRQPAKDWTQTDEHPVVNVSWNKAQGFCEWLRGTTGKKWRLPTNAEWDAAVGKSTFPWGDYYPPNWDDGNYAILANGNPDPKLVGADGIFGTSPVGSFKPNALGFFDLGGNVQEWMLDGFDPTNPRSTRVVRGGGWNSTVSKQVRSTTRAGAYAVPDNCYINAGFRLTLERP